MESLEISDGQINWLAVLTTVIALAAVFIGGLQWRINKLRLKHELFDRRELVYLATIDFLYSIFNDGVESNTHLPEFIKQSHLSPFLFGEDVSRWLDRIREDAILAIINAEDTEVVDAMKRLNKYRDDVRTKFGPYMYLRH